MEGNGVSKNGGIIGISDHGGWAVLVTVARDGTLLDRRRVELVDDEPAGDSPSPRRPKGSRWTRPWRLVERVRVSAERHAVLALDAVATAVRPILGVALRNCPPLPPTIAERIKDYRARNVADWVMYRRRWPPLPPRAVGRPLVRREENRGRGGPGVATSRASTLTFSNCAGPSGRHGTTITSSQWRRPSSPQDAEPRQRR